ncbi:hypothetical protein BASA82_000172 [Batrachochytrium salamandrivorans]|nr:hypothetical protein BASA82_000172 [Batrachochytrium salamandrivorans]
MIGSRVRFQDKRGTIRYVGQVASNSRQPDREWFGVEWDYDNQGLHDGSLFDLESGSTTTYFHCPQTRGSFIKLEKAVLPQTLALAVEQRYESPNLVGEICSLANSALGVFSERDGLQFPQVGVVDFSYTLFRTWGELLRTVRQAFPRAKELIAGENEALTVGEMASGELDFPQLQVFVLTKANVSAVRELLPKLRMDNLVHLCLCNCGMDALPASLPQTLRELDISFNKFRMLPRLPSELAMLNVSHNPLLVVEEPCEPHFHLTCLFVDHAREDWGRLEMLDRSFPKLQELALALDVSLRKRCIVRFPHLVKLDKSPISLEERFKAEVAAIKSREAFPHRDAVARNHPADLDKPQPFFSQSGLVRVCFANPQLAAATVERLLPRQTKLVDLFTIHNRLFSCLPKQLEVDGAPLARADCARDGLLLSDVLLKQEETCQVVGH